MLPRIGSTTWHMPVNIRAEFRNSYSPSLDSPWEMAQPDLSKFSVGGGIHLVSRTMSGISVKPSASTGQSGGEPLGDCSIHSVAEMIRVMSCASTPSLARSSRAMEGKSGEGLSPSVGCARDGTIEAHTGGLGLHLPTSQIMVWEVDP